MAHKLIISFGILFVAALASAATCKSPTVTSTGFTTSDGTIVSQVAYIAEFSLKCSNPEGNAIPLFAEYAGRVTPVAKIGAGQFQVSWSEEIKTSSKGEYQVRIFDEEGFAALRKAQRAGECLSTVKELTSVVVKHPGVFKGPWVNSEFLATSLTVVIAYVAFWTRSKIEN